MAATRRNAMWIEATRQKVQTSQLINRLQDHVFGKVELTNSQVRAALGLIAKTLPDLTESKNETIIRPLSDLSDNELAGIIALDGSEGNPPTPDDPPQLH